MEFQKYGTNYEFDRLVDSTNYETRIAAANLGYGLDVLIHDEDHFVRAAVAEQGYGLDILINDEDICVRQACMDSDSWKEFCANNWETLIINDYLTVRIVVACQGYGLNILIHDDVWQVRQAAKDYLKDRNLTLEQWKQQNGVESDNNIIQDFIYKIDESSKLAVQSNYDSIDDFFNEPISNNISSNVLIAIAVDTKEPIITLEKTQLNNQTIFKFIVDINNNKGESFSIKAIIKSREHLNQLIEQTIEALNAYPEFSKYVDDLENCII